ncbi:hypothetical protein HYT02_03190 [Candidatus Gottesmanbacteria bacterium]|nr:hypothetical protein [Candidatus Gottesmanbacteria bacterium]
MPSPDLEYLRFKDRFQSTPRSFGNEDDKGIDLGDGATIMITKRGRDQGVIPPVFEFTIFQEPNSPGGPKWSFMIDEQGLRSLTVPAVVHKSLQANNFTVSQWDSTTTLEAYRNSLPKDCHTEEFRALTKPLIGWVETMISENHYVNPPSFSFTVSPFRTDLSNL